VVCVSRFSTSGVPRVESTFESVCDAFPNYVPMAPDAKKGAVPITDKDAPKDAKHGLPVSHMERCRRVMDTLLLRLAEEGIVSVKDTSDAVVFAPTTWENPAILEILCTYVYPKVGSGYCKGEFGGAVDDKCQACLNYVGRANGGSAACNDVAESEQELCRFIEAKIGSLPAGTVGAAKALSRARDLNIVEGRFLACRDFLGLCNEEIEDPLKGSSGKSYQELADKYEKASDPYWASRNLYTMPNGAAAVQNALGTKSKTLKKN